MQLIVFQTSYYCQAENLTFFQAKPSGFFQKYPFLKNRSRHKSL